MREDVLKVTGVVLLTGEANQALIVYIDPQRVNRRYGYVDA